MHRNSTFRPVNVFEMSQSHYCPKLGSDFTFREFWDTCSCYAVEVEGVYQNAYDLD